MWNGSRFRVESTSNSAQITAYIPPPLTKMENPPVCIDGRMIMSILEAVSVSKIDMTAGALISLIEMELNRADFTATTWVL